LSTLEIALCAFKDKNEHKYKCLNLENEQEKTQKDPTNNAKEAKQVQKISNLQTHKALTFNTQKRLTSKT
jgi:hypothetical protein